MATRDIKQVGQASRNRDANRLGRERPDRHCWNWNSENKDYDSQEEDVQVQGYHV